MVDIPPDLIIRVNDITRAGFCGAGARRWFNDHGLDFRAFMKNGILATDLYATGDAMAERVVTATIERG